MIEETANAAAQTSHEPIIAGLTWPIAFVLTFVVLSLFAFVAIIMYLEKKYPKKEDSLKLQNPIIIAVVLSTMYIILVFFLQAYDVISKEDGKIWAMGSILIFAGTFFFIHQHISKLKPLDIRKLKKILWQYLWEDYHAKPHTGYAFGSPIPYHKLKPVNGNEGDQFSRIMYFLARTDIRGGLMFLIGMDIGNGYVVECIESPDSSLVKKMLGGDAAKQYDIWQEMLKDEIRGVSQNSSVSYRDAYDINEIQTTN